MWFSVPRKTREDRVIGLYVCVCVYVCLYVWYVCLDIKAIPLDLVEQNC